jgi:large subunit ribosomal protein L7/L12
MAEFTKSQLIDAISSLSVIELSELVKALEEKFGVSAVAPVTVAATPTVGAIVSDGVSVEEEKTEFNVVLTNVGVSKINVIKVVREVTGFGLKEAKDLVDGDSKIVKENVAKVEAEEIKKKLTEAGATVELK